VLVDEIRRVIGNVGQVSQLGRSFTWSTVRGSGTRNLEVVVTVRGGRTRISMQENLSNLIGGIFGGIGGGMGGGGMGPIIGIMLDGLGLGGGAVGVIMPLWLLTTFATARTVYHYSWRRRERQLLRLADRLEIVARELVVPVAPGLGNPAAPRLPAG